MPSCSRSSRAASRRSPSQMRRWIAGSGRRRRSGRGGKRPAWPAPSPRLLPLLELVPDQETVRQHHADRVPVEARPESPLVLVPAQQHLRFLVVPLHPVPAVGILHHLLQRHVRAEVAPEVAPLPVGAILPDQPADPSRVLRPHPPPPDRNEACPPPALTPLPPLHPPPTPLSPARH